VFIVFSRGNKINKPAPAPPHPAPIGLAAKEHKDRRERTSGNAPLAASAAPATVGRVTPCAPSFAFGRTAGRGLPALPPLIHQRPARIARLHRRADLKIPRVIPRAGQRRDFPLGQKDSNREIR